MRWLAVRLDLISVALISITALMMVLMHGQISPAYAGLAISYAVQVRLRLPSHSHPTHLHQVLSESLPILHLADRAVPVHREAGV